MPCKPAVPHPHNLLLRYGPHEEGPASIWVGYPIIHIPYPQMLGIWDGWSPFGTCYGGKRFLGLEVSILTLSFSLPIIVTHSCGISSPSPLRCDAGPVCDV